MAVLLHPTRYFKDTFVGRSIGRDGSPKEGDIIRFYGSGDEAPKMSMEIFILYKAELW